MRQETGTGRRNFAPGEEESPLSDRIPPGEKFYVIWCPTATMPPKVKFIAHMRAVEIAARMALKNPGSKFYVLEAVELHEVPVLPMTTRTVLR